MLNMISVLSGVGLNAVQCLCLRSSCTAACRAWTYLTNCTGPLERRSVVLSCQNRPLMFVRIKSSQLAVAALRCSGLCVVSFSFFSQGYTAHIVSTVSEWCLAFSFISFFFTYIRDFQVPHLCAQLCLSSVRLRPCES